MTMRKAPLLAGLALVLGLPGLRAQNAPRDALVAIPDVEVRSGPSQQYYATSKLRLNDKVTIVKVLDGGWLAIVPPRGSFNWINGAFLDQPIRPGATAPVNAEATLLIGSALVTTPPTTRSQVKAPKGAQVTILGEPMTDTEGKWWPIQPLPRELRYLPPNAVQGNPPVQPGVAAAPPVGQPGGSLPLMNPTPVINDPLWLKAEQAEHDNNLALALGLYTQLATQTQDHNLSVRCLNRIEALKQKLRASPAPPVNVNYPPAVAGDPRGPGAPSGIISQPAVAVPALPPPATGSMPPGPPVTPAAGPLAMPAPSLQTVSGQLQRSAVPLNKQILYALEMAGQRWYVAAQPGVNLEAYVYSNVELQGTVEYNGQLRTYLITATRVTKLQ
jgi:hypothetical protein